MAESVIGEVPSDWLVSTVGEVFDEFSGRIQTGPFGSQLHASDYVDAGIPTVMPANMGDNRIIEEGISRVRPEDVERLARHKLLKGDIVFSRRGDVERRSLVRDREVGWLCGTGCLLVRPPRSHVDSAFLSYWFGHPVVRAWLTQHAVGATMLNLNTGILSSVPLVLPPLVEQRAIAEVLGALDDKYESNQRRVAVAQDLVHTEFLASTVNGARDGSFGEVLSELRSKVSGDTAGVVVLSALAGGRLAASDDYFTKKVYSAAIDKYLKVPQWAFAYNPSRINIGSIGLNSSTTVGAVSPVYVVAQAQSKAAARWVEQALRTGNVKDQIVAYSSGSVRQVLRYHDFAAIRLRLPSNQALSAFEDRTLALYDLVDAATQEANSLSILRDALIPELLSGRLRVKDAASMMENV